VFNQLSNKQLDISYLLDFKLILVYIVLFFLTSFLAGFYPAVILSGYQPTATLYSRFSLGGKNYLQKSLVVLQFALASFLIIGTFVIYSQFNFLTNTNLGYDDSNVVEVSKNIRSHQEAAVFKNELLKNPDIIDVAPKNGGTWNTMAKIENDSSIKFNYATVDESYIPMMKIQLLQGRNFSKDHPADSINSVIVNEAFVKEAGWKDPIGKTVNFVFNKELYSVIGVIKDYHYEPLNRKIGPQLFTMKNSNNYGIYDIKIKPGTAAASLKFIHQKFKDLYPMSPYSYVFKDEQNRKNYEAEAKWKQIMLFAAIFTIFISCIGLFGLSVLSAEKRTKEIGIRKVLGASVSSVVTTLSKDFLKLVLIAMMIAIPAAWLVAGKWIENYPYRVSLSWWMFASAALLVIIIALATISFQAIKAAVANPVKSLRTE
jgi:putative ABC transport system permease protein